MSASPAELPLISVALCVYNGERYLREQLDSILAQEGVRLEIVCVDDRSTDGSLALLQEYAARDARFRVFENESNLGHLRSFEKCMALCSAPLIAPSDQDDIWEPSKLRRLHDALGGADLAYCDSAYIDGDGRPLGRSISDDLDAMHSGRDPLRYVFQNTVSGHALLVRREVFDACLPFPELLYHDWWLAMCAAARNGVVYVDAPLVRFRRHGTAYSPLGKKKVMTSRERRAARKARKSASNGRKDWFPDSPDRRWLEERLYLLQALGRTSWRGNAQARALEQALRDAEAGEHAPRLFHAIWSARASLPPFSGPAWFKAIQFFRRCRRKLRRAQRQGPVPGKLFRA